MPAHALTPASFWARVLKSDGCWEWQGSRDKDGYGSSRLNKRPQQAHRVAWTLTYGPIPAGMIVRHTCDNPPCCRPNHLRLGTTADNNAECRAKGRHRFGNGVLTEAEIPAIRAALATGDTRPAIATRHGVSLAAIDRIAQGRAWRHV